MNLLPEQPVLTLDDYLALGGGQGLANARRDGPDATIERVQAAGLRGRGGAGFPTAIKWRSVREAPGSEKYVVGNGAEGEPGTFKDRTIMRYNPYQIVEGAAIAGFVVDARAIYIVTKGSFTREVRRMRRAIADLEQAGIVGDIPIHLVEGPDEYLFGEETGALEVVEGNDPLPRHVRPFEHGLFATAPQLGWWPHDPQPGERGVYTTNPTVVSNVESMSHANWIMTFGPDEFRKVGSPNCPGTMAFTVCGDVAIPGVYELPMGTPLRTLVEDVGGGTQSGRPVKMMLSGVANPAMTIEEIDTPLDFPSMTALGTGLGSGGYVVYDEAMCAVAVARAFSRFLAVESCGQCPPCKLGTETLTTTLERIEAGRGDATDIGVLQRTLATVTDANRCYLGQEEQRVVGSLLARFPDDFETHLAGRCDLRHDVMVPKIKDFDPSGHFVYDERQLYKRPDWSYADVPVTVTAVAH